MGRWSGGNHADDRLLEDLGHSVGDGSVGEYPLGDYFVGDSQFVLFVIL